MDADTLRASGALLAANIAVDAAIERDAVAAIERSATTLDLLTRLELAPGRRLRAVELCRQLQKSPSHISRLLDRAEEEGLVERRPDPADRRASQVVLTRAGRRVADDFAPRLEAVIDRVINTTLTPAEVDTLVELLGRVEAAAVEVCEPED
jgi:DNA-binding MarR family transcriptional regulator